MKILMEKENTQINLLIWITEYYKLSLLAKKLHNIAASIEFIKKALYPHVAPKFAQIKGQFVNDEEKHQAERRLMLSHVYKHTKWLTEITKHHQNII